MGVGTSQLVELWSGDSRGSWSHSCSTFFYLSANEAGELSFPQCQDYMTWHRAGWSALPPAPRSRAWQGQPNSWLLPPDPPLPWHYTTWKKSAAGGIRGWGGAALPPPSARRQCESTLPGGAGVAGPQTHLPSPIYNQRYCPSKYGQRKFSEKKPTLQKEELERKREHWNESA